jgi:NADPH-dependent 2,4-dienoyl-CoA reductase/sulfur reductase-like enzyme
MKRANYRCAINPEIGNEHEVKHIQPPKAIKKVLIAGGGIGGMQAALTCSERGHEVILCEKTSQLGGVLRCEEHVPFKARLSRYLSHQIRTLSETGVDIRLNTEVTPELASEIAPDVIIAALGARSVKPESIKGWDRANVMSAEELYQNPEIAGKNVVVLGGGLAGLELAVFMGMKGHEVTVVELAPQLNDGGNHLQGLSISGEIEKYGIRISVATNALEINEEGVIGEFTGEPLPPKNPMPFALPLYPPLGTSGTMLFKADTVAYAVGRKPLWDEALSLRNCAPEFYQIGDCTAPGSIYEATSTAYFTALGLGRKY